MRKRHLLGLGLGAVALVQAAAWAGCSPVVRSFDGTGGHTTGTGGQGTGGGGGSCKAGDMVACYDGPPATKDVGNCKSGMATCDAEGKPGACEGQVLPATTIDCSKHEDQDCDGVKDRCALDFIWGKAYGVAGGGGFVVPSLDIDPMGNIAYGGSMNGQLDFGQGTLLVSASGDYDGFVAKVDPTGKTLWAKKFGDATEDQQCNVVRTDAQGSVILAGSYYGSLDGLGIQIPASAGSDDAYVAKLDKDGTAIWARWGGDTDSQSIDAMTLTPSGDVVVGGSFYGTFAFQGGTTFSNTTGNGRVAFIQRFDKDGNAVWGTAMSTDATGDYGSQYIYDMAVDINGDILVTGYFEGTAVFPNGSTVTSAGQFDIFVMKLHGTDGQMLWYRTYGGVNDDEGFGLVTDSQGNVYISGRFDTSLQIGSDTVMPQASQPTGIYLAKLSPSGQPLWLKGYGCGSNTGGMLMSLGENNTLLLVGAFDGTIDFGGGVLESGVTVGDFAAAGFLAKLDADGNHIASRVFQPVKPPDTDGGTQNPYLVVTYRVGATPSTHEIVVGGLAFGQFDLGGGVIGLTTAGGPFLGKYAP